MRAAVFAWSNTLTDLQRENWNTYAFNTPTFNRLGEATRKTGQQMYIRGYVARVQAMLDAPDDAPTSFDLGDFTAPPSFGAAHTSQLISLPFTNTDEWANETGSALLIYQGRPQNATRIYGKGPYQLAFTLLGDDTTPPTSPQNITSIFPFAAGQRIFIKINATRADGRYSSPTLMSTIAT
jgi:hypothetical protein